MFRGFHDRQTTGGGDRWGALCTGFTLVNVNVMIEEHAFPSFFDLAYFLFSRFDCKRGKKTSCGV